MLCSLYVATLPVDGVQTPQELPVFPKPRYVMSAIQRQRLAEKVRNAVQIVSQLAMYRPTRQQSSQLLVYIYIYLMYFSAKCEFVFETRSTNFRPFFFFSF